MRVLPANLTPQYLEADARYRAAETDEEKLAALEDMYALIPKHKGTEKMRADIKKRMSKLRQKEASGPSKHGPTYSVEREGAGQIVLMGNPNSGKSLLVRRLTAAEPEVADYPFTTRRPLPGMMEYEDILIQLVDVPPIAKDMTEHWVLALARSADAVILVVDVAGGAMLDDVDNVREELAKSKIQLISRGEEPRGGFPVGTVFRPAIIAANKVDIPGADENLDIFRALYESDLPVIPVSAQNGEGLEELKRDIFDLLGVVRVYTKIPGKHADMDHPFVLKRGCTVDDLAATVHKEFVGKMRFARAWGKNKPDGVMVGREQELEDGDIIELHV